MKEGRGVEKNGKLFNNYNNYGEKKLFFKIYYYFSIENLDLESKMKE